MGVKVTLP
jgi:hypothetical protein